MVRSEKEQPDTLRCFVALALPQNVKDGLQAAQDVLRGGQDSVVKARWVRPEGTHLTLFFLGEIAADRLDAALAVVRATIEMPRPSFTLHLADIGTFPALNAPRVVWAGVAGDVAALRVLQAAVARALVGAGFHTKDAHFSPHLTLARIRENMRDAERAEVGAALQKGVPDAAAVLADTSPFVVAGATFFKSTLAAGGAIYSHLADYSFGATT